MDRGGIQAELVDLAVLHESHERRHHVTAAVRPAGRPVDQFSLGPLTPKHVRVAKGGHEFVGRRIGKRGAVRRGLRGLMHHPPEPAVHLVAERRLVGVALAVGEARRRRVVLDDEVVPVDHPHLAVGADVGLDRRGPLVVAGHEAPGHPAAEGRARGGDLERGHHVTGRLADERGAVPILAGIRPGCVEPMAGGGRKPAVMIHLADRRLAFGATRPRGEFHLRRAGNAAECGGVPAAHPLVDPVGQRHVLAGVAVGRGAEEHPLLAEPEAPGAVVGAPQELELRAIRLEAEEALLELQVLAPHCALEARIADDAVHPAVEAPGEVARAGVRVERAPAGEQLPADVGLPVAVGVLEIERVRSLGDDQPAVVGQHARADRERLCEHRPRVERAVAVRVVESHDPVVPLPLTRQDDPVGVVDALGDEQPAVVVEGERQRLRLKERLGGDEIDREAHRRDGVLARLRGIERLLHLGDRLAHLPPVGLGHVEGHLRRLILEGHEALRSLRHLRTRHVGPGGGGIAAGGEADAALDEVLKPGVAPGSLVVPPGGVEHAALALGADPGPGLATLPLDPLLEHGPAPLVVLGVDVGFVPAPKAAEPLHHRMLGGHDHGGELAGAVLLELCADQVDPDGRVLEAEARAVERHEPLPAADILHDRRLGRGRDRLDVGVDSQDVVVGEPRGGEVADVLGVDQVDAPAGEHRLEVGEPPRNST